MYIPVNYGTLIAVNCLHVHSCW